MIPRRSASIWDLATKAAPSLRLYRAGRIQIVEVTAPDGHAEFDVQAPPVCEPPCSTKLIHGTCPACCRPITLTLGRARRNKTLEPVAQIATAANRQLIGFSMDAQPDRDFLADLIASAPRPTLTRLVRHKSR